MGDHGEEPAGSPEGHRPRRRNLGGKVKDGYLTFGEYDIIAICEFPDNVSAAAFSLAVAAAGACKAFKTTPLLTTADGLKAMKKASSAGYEPPG